MKAKLQFLRRISAQAVQKTAAVGAITVAGTGAAMADPAAITAAFSAVSTSAGSMISEAWPIVTLVMGGLVTIGLFKKVISRAT